MQLFNWDTVYAASIGSVNKALAASPQKLISSFSFSLPAPTSGKGSGKFGAWQIVGGSDKLLHLLLPIASGSLQTHSGKTVDLSGISVVVEVALQLLPLKTSPGTSELRFTIHTIGKSPGKTVAGMVTPIKINDPSKKLSFENAAFLPATIAQCLAENGQAISWVFASISPIKGKNYWLSPKASGFFYFASQKESYLAVLGITKSTNVSKIDRQLDPALVEGKPQAAFAFSKELFLRNVIMPVLPACFGHGTNASTFIYFSVMEKIISLAPIATKSVKSGLITYYPKIDSLQIGVEGASLVTTVTGSCEMGAGITMTFVIKSRNAVSVDLKTKTLRFASDPKPIVHHDFQIPWYLWLLSLGGALAAPILLIVTQVVADGIADGLNKHKGDFVFSSAPPPSIRWTGLEEFHATTAGLKDSFYLKGNLEE